MTSNNELSEKELIEELKRVNETLKELTSRKRTLEHVIAVTLGHNTGSKTYDTLAGKVIVSRDVKYAVDKDLYEAHYDDLRHFGVIRTKTAYDVDKRALNAVMTNFDADTTLLREVITQTLGNYTIKL